MANSYDCMTPDELALWIRTDHPSATVKSPCVDCPAEFRRQAIAAKCCRWYKERHAAYSARYRDRLRAQVEAKRAGKRAAEWERVEARRKSWRESKRRARKRVQ